MTRNLWSEQRDLVCLSCAKRIVAPRQGGSKYTALREHLWRRGQFTRLVTLEFRTIEGLVSSDLPLGALRNQDWWSNTDTTAQGYAWTSAGWSVQSVDLSGRRVTFVRTAQGAPTFPRKRKRATPKKPFITIPEKPFKIRAPSKTHVAKVLARARNVERRTATASLQSKLKPRPAYEKRLYKPEAKPRSNE